ncbi:MAG: hypothetical protein SVU32_02260 [Candidatus Nanohaloarchaea archaeon]|nr:hypothetical protein [Candidatus Nanohaloarchaea archaeon]
MPDRHFLLVQDDVRTDTDFSIDGLAGNGRLDIGCRFLNACLFTSYELRRDVTVHLLFRGEPDPPLHLAFRGKKISGLHPDERSIAGYIKKNIGSFRRRKVSANTGVFINQDALTDVVEKVDATPVMMHEEGDDIDDVTLPDTPLFVLGDHNGLQDADVETLRGAGAIPVSLGSTAYQAQQVASYLNILLDHRGL